MMMMVVVNNQKQDERFRQSENTSIQFVDRAHCFSVCLLALSVVYWRRRSHDAPRRSQAQTPRKEGRKKGDDSQIESSPAPSLAEACCRRQPRRRGAAALNLRRRRRRGLVAPGSRKLTEAEASAPGNSAGGAPALLKSRSNGTRRHAIPANDRNSTYLSIRRIE